MTTNLKNFRRVPNEWFTGFVGNPRKDSGVILLEFIDNLKVDLFPQEVCVPHPRVGLLKIPRGCDDYRFLPTPCIRILVMACVSARIGQTNWLPLQTKLEKTYDSRIIYCTLARAQCTLAQLC